MDARIITSFCAQCAVPSLATICSRISAAVELASALLRRTAPTWSLERHPARPEKRLTVRIQRLRVTSLPSREDSFTPVSKRSRTGRNAPVLWTNCPCGGI